MREAKEERKQRYLNEDLRLVTLAGTPENQRENREERDEENDEANIQPHIPAETRGVSISVVVIVFVVGLWLLLYLLPGGGVSGVLEGRGEPRRGGLAGVVDRRAVVVVVRRAHGAGPVGHFLDVVVRRALHEVDGSAR